jgi:transposase
MVFEMRERTGERRGAIARVADQLGIHREALRGWIRQAEIDGGQRPGVPTSERQRIAELERENRELRRANEILNNSSSRLSPGAGPDRKSMDWCACLACLDVPGLPQPARP